MSVSRLDVLRMLGKMRELCGLPGLYTPFVAADAWGKEIDPRNPNARKFDLSGALLAAVDALYDPQDQHKRLKKLEVSTIESKRAYAHNQLRKRGEKAKILYGYGWGALERASLEVTGADLWKEKSFQTAMDVLERARLRVCESLNIRNRERGLGLARIDDPYTLEELELLEKISDAGDLGHKLETGDEVLASYDLYRRGLIVEVWPVAWTYRRRG